MVELEGLEGIYFQKKLQNNKNWQHTYNVALNTSSGQKFQQVLLNQNKWRVYYFVCGGEASQNGFTIPCKNFDSYWNTKYEPNALKNDDGSWIWLDPNKYFILNNDGGGFLFQNMDNQEMQELFKNGKSLLFIEINENKLNFSTDLDKAKQENSDASADILYEENSHGINDIQGKMNTMAEDPISLRLF